MTTTLTTWDRGTFTPADGTVVSIDNVEWMFHGGECHLVSDIESGRVRLSGPDTWYARITYAWPVWRQLRPARMIRTV